MKKLLSLFTNLFFLLVISTTVNAADIYAEYKMTGMNNAAIISKIYAKNGSMRTDANINMGGKAFTTTTLMLKNKPNVFMIFNSATKTYTETKSPTNATVKDVTIKVLGNEKVGKYNCTRVKMTADGKSWEAWYTKDLPTFTFPVNGNNDFSSQKIINELKSKGITGMIAKIVFRSPGANAKAMTMELVKFETKTLSESLFAIPAGYKKSSVSFDPEAIKKMNPAQKQEMIMKMMKEQTKQ